MNARHEARSVQDSASLEGRLGEIFGPDQVDPVTPRPGRSRRRRSGQSQSARRVTIIIVVLAAVGAAAAGGEPTGWAPADLVFRSGFAGFLTWVAPRARRSTWIWCSVVAVVASGAGLWVAVAAASLGIGVVAAWQEIRRAWLGALVVGLAVQAVLRLPDVGFFASSTLIAAVACGPILISSYRFARRRRKRQALLAVLVVAAFVALTGVMAGVAAYRAEGQVEAAIDFARDGLNAAREGDIDRAESLLSRASQGFRRGNNRVGVWWMAPTRLVPVVGQNVRALAVATDQGARVADAALETLPSVDADRLRWASGQLDLRAVASAEESLRLTAETLSATSEALDEVETSWLLGPLGDRVNLMRAEADDAYSDAVLAADVAEIAPAVLGGDGTRRYFVVFTTPAESRGIGGFMGSWAELTADNGKLTLTRSGRTAELNNAEGSEDRAVAVPAVEPAEEQGGDSSRLGDFVRRYASYQPETALQDVTLSPDFPTVAEVYEQLYPQSGGNDVDGVVLIDPFALAALMEFTGPIEIEGLDRLLTSENAAQFLLIDQYAEFPLRSERADFLAEASRITFEKLTEGDLPPPRKIVDRLAPLVNEGRLLLHSVHEAEQRIYERVGLDGAMPAPGPVDSFSVVTQNGANNKIDVYLEREIDYAVEVDPLVGRLKAEATIRLTNAVPSPDLARPVVGNRQGFPVGTNEVFLNIYTPLGLSDATLDGEAMPMGADRELGRWVYSGRFQIPPGETRTVVLDLAGEVAPFDRYELVWGSQPLVNADQVQVSVSSLLGDRLSRPKVFELEPGQRTATARGSLAEDEVLRVGVGN